MSLPTMMSIHNASSSLNPDESSTETLEENDNSTSVDTLADHYYYINTLLWHIVPPFLLIFGTFGNVMIVVVMRGMRASQSTACLSVYFTALAVSDQCLLIFTVVWYWVDIQYGWPVSYFRYELLCSVPTFAWFTSSLTSAWFLVAMTYQRVTSVVVPHRVGVLCTVKRGKIIIAVIVLAACAFNLHILFTYSYWPDIEDCTARKKYADFVKLFIWVDLSLASLIPFVVLCVGNTILVWNVIKSMQFARKMRESYDKQMTSGAQETSRMTTTLVLTSAAFLAFTLPTCVFDAYMRTVDLESGGEDLREEMYLWESVTTFFWIAASASNFYLYLLSGRKFRQEAKRYLCWCGKSNNK